MKDDEAKALYDRAAAVGFKLEPGCRVRRAGALNTVVWAADNDVGITDGRHLPIAVEASDVWCDFRERPSLGCLLGQVREALGRDASAELHRFYGDLWSPPCGDEEEAWWVSVDDGMHQFDAADTEEGALVAALEAAAERLEVTP